MEEQPPEQHGSQTSTQVLQIHSILHSRMLFISGYSLNLSQPTPALETENNSQDEILK